MRYKLKTTLITILLLFITGANSAILAIDLDDKTKLNIGSTFIFQEQSLKYYRPLTYYLNLTREFENDKITLSLKNRINPLIDKTAFSGLSLEFIYQKSFPKYNLIMNFGNFGFSKYFAKNNYTGDTASQFLTGNFASDVVIESMHHIWGSRLNYTINYFDFDIGCFPILESGKNADIFTIGQITYKPSNKENYRLYLWLDSREFLNVLSQEQEKYKVEHNKVFYGIGASVDKEIYKQIGVFAKFGYKNPSILICTCKPALSLSWSAGTQIKPIWCRKNDVLGLAIGQIYQNFMNHAETQIELYYKFTINDKIAISPIIQYIIGTQTDEQHNLFSLGIRTNIEI